MQRMASAIVGEWRRAGHADATAATGHWFDHPAGIYLAATRDPGPSIEVTGPMPEWVWDRVTAALASEAAPARDTIAAPKRPAAPPAWPQPWPPGVISVWARITRAGAPTFASIRRATS